VSTLEEKLSLLKASVEAAQNELHTALSFHAVWKPVASDKKLIARLQKSPALVTITIIRTALKGELLQALHRLWENLERAGHAAKNRDVLPALTKERSTKPSMQAVVRRQLAQHLAASSALFDNYTSGYAKATFDRWMRASLVTKQAADLSADEDASDIGELITDLRELASRLASFALGESNDFEDIASQHGNLSRRFWGLGSEPDKNVVV